MATRILIADDHRHMRAALASLIRESGENWEVCGEAEDGQAAVDEAAELKPDLMILDLMLPCRDGISAARAIRMVLPNLPIVLYTLWVSPFLQSEAEQVGIQAVVQKSNGKALVAAIREALAGPSASSSQAPPQRASTP